MSYPKCAMCPKEANDISEGRVYKCGICGDEVCMNHSDQAGEMDLCFYCSARGY